MVKTSKHKQITWTTKFSKCKISQIIESVELKNTLAKTQAQVARKVNVTDQLIFFTRLNCVQYLWRRKFEPHRQATETDSKCKSTYHPPSAGLTLGISNLKLCSDNKTEDE